MASHGFPPLDRLKTDSDGLLLPKWPCYNGFQEVIPGVSDKPIVLNLTFLTRESGCLNVEDRPQGNSDTAKRVCNGSGSLKQETGHPPGLGQVSKSWERHSGVTVIVKTTESAFIENCISGTCRIFL